MLDNNYEPYNQDIEDDINRINLRVLKKKDRDIEKILCKCKYSSLQELDRASKIWHSCDTAGPLFFVRKKHEQKLFLILLNQKNRNDYMEYMGPDVKIEFREKEKFIFFVNQESTVKGLWISDLNDLKSAENLITKYKQKYQKDQ